MTPSPPETPRAPFGEADERRRRWHAVLVHAQPDELARAAAPALSGRAFEWLRRPETGLTMVRARIGNGGDRFNLGEATVVRCALRYRPPEGVPVVGIAYLLGRDARRAETVAQLDALLQIDALHHALMHGVVEPLRRAIEQRRHAAQARAAASRVRFFTLQPEAA